MKKTIFKVLAFLIFIFLLFLFYYIYLPVINIHSSDLWIFVIMLLFLGAGGYKLIKFKTANKKIIKSIVFLNVFLISIYLLGSILSSPIVNAKKYQSLINIKNGNFKTDIKEISYDEIPILDKDTAINLGSRKMGSIVDMVSQFEVNNLYTQINYKSKPTRVTPLDYGNIFKWLINRKNGIPAYMMIDMTTQETQLVNLDDGIKYSFSEPLNRNVKRHLRFNYPTYMFDNISFEIDDNGTPYWICPVKTYSIGLFGGPVIKKVVLLNAITGELSEYNIEDVPMWVDSVYSAELLISYYNYYGMLKNGYFNSILGQKGCLKTTEGYNYIALNDDVYVYTGVTSVSGDRSNVGFVLMNKRTGESKYYTISGAQETSAMASAEGQVQHLGYKATFPLLLNISDQPTYFIALKDEAGLVKKYAMVNIEKYQIVAIGDTVSECENNYVDLLSKSNIELNKNKDKQNINGKIMYLKEIVIDGNSHIFIKIDNNTKYFGIPIKNNLNILNYQLNDNISIEYEKQENYNIITNIN
ncbi:CvpA family protein [uncultured Tyzzerella sp.]|uniref:CvpA family protein n=1 Tax=uncultured Tyzzerella sp. TaxID=2321398 RepID=UPI002943BC00|nr:CvpA family protein [uncultured Tyzzerella sp.]